MLVFEAATADEVLKEIEEQEEWERCRIAVVKKAPRGEWASLKKDPGHGKPPPHPQGRIAVLDNLRVFLILILTMYNSVLETISNHTGDIEKDHPIQFAILSLFTGIYRVIVVSLFFYVSGASSWSLLVRRREPPLQFLLKKSRKTLVFTIGCYIASKAAEYVYGPFPETFSGPRNPSYYASGEGKISLLRGPIYYSIALLILDVLFVFCRVIHINYWRYDLVERLIGTKHRFRVTSVLVPVVVMCVCPLLLLCGYITLPGVPARLQPFFFYIHLDTQTPFSSILAYAAAVNQYSLQLPWSRPDGKVIQPRLVMITIRTTLIFATGILIGLYHYYPSTIALYISPNLPPRQLFDSALISASTLTPTVLYLAWAESIYRVLLVTFASIFYIRGIQLFLLNNYYYQFTRLASVQTIIHMFFVIGIARHSSWIGSPVLRCIFVGLSSILCGWIAGLVPLYLYYLAKVCFNSEPFVAEPAEQEREEPIKEAESTQDVESQTATPEAASTNGETPVNVVEREGGEGSKVLASTADVEENMQEAPPRSGRTVVGEAIRESINGTTSLHSAGDETVHNKDAGSTAEDRGGEANEKTVQEQDSQTMKNPQAEGHPVAVGVKRKHHTRKIVLTVNIARAFLIFLLTLHTSVMAVVAYLPEGFQTSSPKYFAAISLFSAFHQAAVIPAFFFLSGISSYLSLSTKYLKRSSFWLPWDRLLALSFVTNVNFYLLTSSISQLDRVWPPTTVTVRSPDTLSLAARKPEDLLRCYTPTDYIMLLILLDLGYCALRTITRQSERLTGLVSGHRFYFTLQGIALCAQLVYLCATLVGKDPFLSQGFAWKWKLDAHFPLLYINAYAMGVNLSYFHATFFAGPSRRATWARAILTALVQTVIAYATLWALYRIFPSQIPVYVDPRFHPHRVLDAGASMSQANGWHTQAAVIASYACWSMATFLLLTATIASFILSSNQSELLSKGPKSTRYYALVLRKAFWYSFFHAAPAVALAGRTSWIKDIGVRIIFVMVGSVMFVLALISVIAWLMSWPRVKIFVVRVVLGAKLLI